MSQVTGVPKVTYAVFDETINQWAWFWIEGLRGTLEEACLWQVSHAEAAWRAASIAAE